MDLTLDQARRIVDAALERGRQSDLAPLAVAVLDAGGHLKAFGREDGAGIIRPQIAIGKAWGALGMGMGTRALAGKSSEFLAALAAMSGGNVVPSPGGVLILSGDRLIGAVGVTGDTGSNDETCAVAGIEAVGLEPDTG
jgi:uncharacterized protein GlcG (DUF336 family)